MSPSVPDSSVMRKRSLEIAAEASRPGTVVVKLTDRDPERRYQSARAVAATLAGFGRWVSLRNADARSAAPRVLVVEDDPRLRRLMVGLLRDCTCVEAGDGKAAWAELEKAPFDLLVLDVNLPEMSGPELLARVRADEAMSARTRTHDNVFRLYITMNDSSLMHRNKTW